MQFMQVTDREIRQLDKLSLTKLVHRLLLFEAKSAGIPESSISCTFNIDTGDGGEDASIRWKDGPDETSYLSRDTLIQVKATKMSAADCKEELLKDGKPKRKGIEKKTTERELTPKNDELKPKIKDLFGRGGRYILFCNTDGKQREETLRAVAKEHGFENASVFSLNPTKIADWVNKYFFAVALVKQSIDSALPGMINSWQHWSQFPEHRETDFVSNEKLDGYMQLLRDAARKKQSVVRLCGLPGIGKSRLVIEAFAADEFRRIAGYVDTSVGGDVVANQLSAWSQNNIDGLLVVDNCSPQLHCMLSRMARHSDSKLTLITLYSDPYEAQKGEEYIELQPLDKKTTERIIDTKFPELPRMDLARIVDFAEGFPQMAVLLCEADLRNEGALSRITPKELVNRLLFPDGKVDEKALMVISVCSLFNQFAFDDGLAGETSLIAKVLCGGMEPEEFCRLAMQFKRRNILEPHMGAYTKVTPRPLAWRLAADWWESCSDTLAKLLIDEEWPMSLAEAMCSQLAFLRETPAAHRVAEELCKPSCPFVSAESLNSNRGSRLFCALVEVNPDITLEALERIFLNMPEQGLLAVEAGRRYLVWALEKLCWDSRNFERAGFLLHRFAVAENETRISNNATGQLKKLFRVHLPGTKANLTQRISLLDEMAKAGCPEELLIQCLFSGFYYGQFTRTMGMVEAQGGRIPEKDFEPTRLEIKHYWEQLLNRLLPKLGIEDLRDEILTHLAGMFRYLIRFGFLDQVELIVEAKLTCDGRVWVEGLEQLCLAIKEERGQQSFSQEPTLRALVDKLQPQTFEDQYRLIVAEASYSNFDHDSKGQLVDVNAIRAESFGEECGREWPKWIDYLPLLLSGEQREAPAFAKGLSSSLSKPLDFIEACLRELATNKNGSNPSVLGEFLAELRLADYALVDSVMNRLEQRKDVITYVPWLIYRAGIDELALNRYARLLCTGLMKVADLHCLNYGAVLKNISPSKMTEFLRYVISLEADARPVLVELISRFIHQQGREQCPEVMTLGRDVICSKGLLRSLDGRILHDWQQLALSLFKEPDQELASSIAQEIVSICGNTDHHNIYKYDRVVQPIVNLLLGSYFDVCWPILSAPLGSADHQIESDMLLILTNMAAAVGEQVQSLQSAPQDKLAKWCKENRKGFFILLAGMRLWVDGDNREMSLTPLGWELLNAFADDESFLDLLGARLASVGGWGSLRPQYEAREALMDRLSNHSSLVVKRWAAKQLMYYKRQVGSAKKRDEEQAHGIFDGFGRD